MVNVTVVVAKLAELKDRRNRASAHCPATAAELAGDRDALDLVAFNLMLAVQSAADIAAHIVSDEGWPTAKTLAAAFATLEQQGVITKASAQSLGRAVGLRNVVAHGYAGVDVNAVHAAASAGVADLDRFAREVSTWLSARSP
jgi:uncharacterized protein YutE (UPF0331/DUF86 family)